MIKSVLIASIAFLPLAGCLYGPPPQTPVQTCSGYGYKNGTSDFRNCVAEESRLQKEIASNRSIARRNRARDNFNNSWYCRQGGCN